MQVIQFKELSDIVIGAAFSVHAVLGPGLLERVYENAFGVELEHLDIRFECQKAYPVEYRNRLVGEYYADLVIDDSIIVEIKAVGALTRVMEAQLIHYLRISGIKVGYLINFNAPSVVWKRFVS